MPPDEMCDSCCGEPLTDGRTCICDGKGTLFAQMSGLRKLVIAKDRVIDALRLMLRVTGVSGKMLDAIEKEAMELPLDKD